MNTHTKRLSHLVAESPETGYRRKRTLLSFSCVILAVVASIGCVRSSYAQTASTVWPMFHADVRRTGLSSIDTRDNPGMLKWLLLTTGQLTPSSAIEVESSPAVGADGTVYVGADQSVFAINPDGTIKWRYQTNSLVGFSSPAIGTDGTIYIGSDDFNLYALEDGGQGSVTEKWAFQAGNYIESSPALGPDGTIYFGSWDGNVNALNPDGTLKWKFAAGGPIYTSSPAIGTDGTIYIGSLDNSLYAITDGGQGNVRKRWAFPTKDRVCTSPAIGDDGTIYFGSDDHNLYALTDGGPANVIEKWSFTTGNFVESSPAIGPDGTIYFGSHDKNLYALSDNGTNVKEKWAFPMGGAFSSPAIGADGAIYVGSFDQNVYALTDNGRAASQKWAIATGSMVRSSPAIASDGTVYVGSADDNVYAIGSSSPAVSVKLGISKRSLNFGRVRTGRPSLPRWIVIKNATGRKMASGVSISYQGQRLDPAFLPFNVSSTCGQVLEPGTNCRIRVIFVPDQRGNVAGNLLLFDNAKDSPQIVNLSGKGV